MSPLTKAGGVYLPLNTTYTAHELEYFITNAAASIIVVDASKAEKGKACRSDSEADANQNETSGTTSLADPPKHDIRHSQRR